MQAIAVEKADFRKQLNARRSSLPTGLREQYNGAIHDRLVNLPLINQANSLFCFISMDNEPATHPFLKFLLAEGKTLAVPRILPEKTMIAVELQDWQSLQPGELGIMTPASSQPYSREIDICITPGLGFTLTGKRLGFGRGYYDKWFSTHRVGHKIALAYECQIVDELPVDENDIPVDMIVTEERIIVIN